MSEEALQIAEKGREAKSKGQKERYIHLNAEFQRIASRDKNPSSVINAKKYRKTTEWKTRDLFKKTGDTKGIFHAKMGTIRYTNDKDLTEAVKIQKRW